MRGRKPVLTKLEVLQGTERPSRRNEEEPKPAPEIPSCPSHLDAGAKREWKRVTKQLAVVGLVTQID
jgi:phage terminase small subunit